MIIAVVLIVVVEVGAGIFIVGFAANRVSNLIVRQHTVTIVNGLITVEPGRYNHYLVSVPVAATAIRVRGNFTVSGGAGYSIQVFVMDEGNYLRWENNYPSTSLYNSGQATIGTISATLASSGVYYLVYSNTYTSTPENVQSTADLHYFA
jgi:hypothetical protein